MNINEFSSTPVPFSLRRRGAGDEAFWLILRSLLRNLSPELALGFIRFNAEKEINGGKYDG
jgi:hypothetical protein